MQFHDHQVRLHRQEVEVATVMHAKNVTLELTLTKENSLVSQSATSQTNILSSKDSVTQ